MTDDGKSFGRWLYERHGYKVNNYRPWAELGDGDQSLWEHYAAQTRQALQETSFLEPRIPISAPGACRSCPGGCPEPVCTCSHEYHGHGDRSLSPGLRGCLMCRCELYTAAHP